jgi:hypothetical protein
MVSKSACVALNAKSQLYHFCMIIRQRKKWFSEYRAVFIRQKPTRAILQKVVCT